MNIEDHLYNDGIVLPGNPITEVAVDLGLDEMVAFLFSTVGTALMSGVTLNPMVLSVTGPIIEKLGFQPIHVGKSIIDFFKESKEMRKNYSYYLKEAEKDVLSNLAVDIAGHDPVYTCLTLLGLYSVPDAPPWLVSAASFFAAVGIAALGKVGFDELRQVYSDRMLLREGFWMEDYYETRFFLNSAVNPLSLMDDVMGKFGLVHKGNSDYNDKYFEHHYKGFNNRQVKSRFRERSLYDSEMEETGLDRWSSYQVIESRAREHEDKNKNDSYRFYVTRRKKFWMVTDDLPRGFDKPAKPITFTRSVAANQGIQVSTDLVYRGKDVKERGMYIAEIKAWPDAKGELIDAMRYIMSKYYVYQTTLTKQEIVELGE